MGKSQPQLPVHLQQDQNHHGSSLFVRCSMGFSRISGLFSFKQHGFDAKASVKHSATVQAYFILQKPISFLLPQISRLEYDINAEIGVPHTKVAILSMHKASESNRTHVVFGLLSDPINSPIKPVSLIVLRSSLIELFNQRSNLTLTTSIFGQPSSFEILKFPGGITIIPEQSPSIWMLPQVLFNFTLPNSIREIEENFAELKEQLKSGLHLKPYESVYMQVTNKAGSTREAPVTVQASIASNLGNLVPLRLKQLAETITGSLPARNLGLDHSVFGKVKEISLSSYLYHSLDAPTPSPAPSPSPSPELNDYARPTIAPTPAILPSPHSQHISPCSPCIFSSPTPKNRLNHPSPPPSLDRSCGGSHVVPGPSPMPVPPSHSASRPPMYERSEMPPDLPPLPAVSYVTRSGHINGDQKGSVPPSVSVSPYSSSSAAGSFNHLTGPLFLFLTLMILQTL